MGKHDKKAIAEKVNPQKESFKKIRDGIESLADSCEFYRERIKTLEKRVAELEAELNEAKRVSAEMVSLYEDGVESLCRNEARNDEIIERKNEEIQMAKEAIYLAAMREVSLR